MPPTRDLLVFGYGLLFERRFGEALEYAQFSVLNARQTDQIQDAAMLVSFLDGPPIKQPQPDDPLLQQRCIWISDVSVPTAFDPPAIHLDENVSSATLLAHLKSLFPETDQRRHEERHPTDLPVRYRVGRDHAAQTLSSRLANLSLGGAFVESAEPPEPGDHVELEISPSPHSPPIVLNARVVFGMQPTGEPTLAHDTGNIDKVCENNTGFGVAFCANSFETRSMLQRVLRQIKLQQRARQGDG